MIFLSMISIFFAGLQAKKSLLQKDLWPKNILPAYAGFYDAAFLQVVMGGNTAAQLYADWYTPETSWTWGDGRIFVSGTKGCAEIRTAGDPFISKSPLLLQVTDAGAPSLVDLECPPATVSEDFF